MSSPTIFFTEVPSPLGTITLTAAVAGLCGLYFHQQRHWPADSDSWQRDDGKRFAVAKAALKNYFAEKGRVESPTLDIPEGTAFQQKVWQALRLIPVGETRTYAEIADLVGSPNAVRAVGAAIGRNPISIFIPCHRVIGGNGSLTGYAGGVEKKAWLLRHESTSK